MIPDLTCVIPVYNEEKQLFDSMRKLAACFSSLPIYDWRILIADNGSTDDTANIGRAAASELARVDYVRLEEKGRGRALFATWMNCRSKVAMYMDVDLSTDLVHVMPLIEPIFAGKADISIGSRLHTHSKTTRGWKREFLSKGYNRLLRLALNVELSDAQCGFKAVSHDVIATVLPYIKSRNWFFDTELLVIASWLGYRIHEVPVKWVDDPASRVKLLPTISEDVAGILRLRRTIRRRSDWASERNCKKRDSRLAGSSDGVRANR